MAKVRKVFYTLFLVVGLSALVGIALAAWVARRASLRAEACRANLRQLALAVCIYAEDYDEVLPPAPSWCDGVLSYTYARPLPETPEGLAKQGFDGAFVVEGGG